ncbi:unnamed protein product [Arabis nemorensis]|uniref:Uncharacterized protein n=1 Tax=Arabis nemorensis TaxID=586526 RepID=A0A565AUT7_9BRAS|nr:unnamed protein product [Arabis nemorensis]
MTLRRDNRNIDIKNRNKTNESKRENDEEDEELCQGFSHGLRPEKSSTQTLGERRVTEGGSRRSCAEPEAM